MADADGEDRKGSSEPTADDILKELESQVEQPETSASGANGGWLPKLSNYMFSVTKEEKSALEQGAKEIKTEFGKVGEEVNNSINAIGGLLSGAWGIQTSSTRDLGAKQQARFEQYFPQLSAESVLESYECQLVQRFRCYHNAILPEKTFLFAGTLFLTVNSIAFFAHSDLSSFGKRSFPVVTSLEDLDKVQKVGEPPSIKLTTKKQVSMIFASFPSDADLSAAFVTIENLSQGSDPAAAGAAEGARSEISVVSEQASTS